MENPLRVAAGAKIILTLIALSAPLTHPHIIRQVDTLGVSLSYALRFLHQPLTLQHLFPAVLNNQGTSGIMPMEFPLINLLFSPAFMLPISYELQMLLARLGLFFFNLMLIFKIHLKVKTTPYPYTAYFIFLCGLPSIYTHRFMPDATAMLISVLGILIFPQSRWRSILLITVGLTMKPPIAVVLLSGFFFLPPDLWRAYVGLNAIPILLVFAYYLGFNGYLADLSPIELIFATSFQLQLTHLKTLLVNGTDWLGQLSWYWIVPGLPLYILAHLKNNLPLAKLLAAMMIQFILVILLVGDHALVHPYYLMGTALTGALIIHQVTQIKWCRYLVLLLLAAQFSEQLLYEIIGLKKVRNHKTQIADCQKIKHQLQATYPEIPFNRGYFFRSAKTYTPFLGLCMGEFEGALRGEWGLAWAEDAIPTTCKLKEDSPNSQVKVFSCPIQNEDISP